MQIPPTDKVTGKAIQKFEYRVAGVPVLVRRAFSGAPHDRLEFVRDVYAHQYFQVRSSKDRRRIIFALLVWPLLLVRQMAHFTWRNGRAIAIRHGRSVPMQLIDQLRCYFSHGILPRWYYIFSLYETDVRKQARCFLNRYETKLATFRLLNWPGTSPLNDKAEFASYCASHGIPTVSALAVAQCGRIDWVADQRELPSADLFVKPVSSRGGKGAERWDYVGEGQFRDIEGSVIDGTELIERFRKESHKVPRLVQPRVVNHPDLSDLSNGALCTVRVMTCLDEQCEPEVVASVFRMAIGKNVTVDNIHAGGVAAEVRLETGSLGQASNLGEDARLGWLDFHPDTRARICGRTLPFWNEVKALAVRAHRAFADRTVIGWDIAITDKGPQLIEGNSGPDVDLLQRPMRRGLGCGRLGQLMAFHLERRGWNTSDGTAA